MEIKYLIPAMAFFIFLAAIIGYTNYNDRIVKQEEYQSQQQLKAKQQSLDEDFRFEQGRKEALIQAQEEQKYQDKDGDGLTLEQENELGTDDNNLDSDGDGITDGEDAHPAGGGEIFKKKVYWEHNGLSYTTEFGVPEDWYLYYKNYDRSEYSYQDGRFATPEDLSIRTIAQDITDVSLSTGDPYKFGIAVDFVESMTYQYDVDFNNNQEYPKYAIETIIDQRGDCEDTSFLMASILEALGIDTIFLLYSDHAAIGVRCDSGCSGTYYNYKGKKFYFLETTGEPGSWELGRVWGKYAKENPTVIDV